MQRPFFCQCTSSPSLISVSGTIAPQCNGTYVYHGQFAGRESWALASLTYYIWWDAGATDWIISDEKGAGREAGDVWWTRDAYHEEGDYAPEGMAVETATAVHV